MNAKIRKKLFELCASGVAKQLPEFLPYTEKTIYLWPSEFLFRSTTLIAPKAAFIVLSPNAKSDEVTVEVGWSDDGLFPKLVQRPCGGSAQNSALLKKNQAVVRVPSIKTLTGMMDDWLPVSLGAEEVVAKRILAMLIEDGIPYLQNVYR